MNFYVKLAAKNLWRHGKRTLITAIAIAVGLSAYLFVDSMLKGADADSEINLVRYETGSLRIYSPEGATIRQRLSLKAPLEQGPVALAALETAGYHATGRVSFLGELAASHPDTGESIAQTVRVAAIDPRRDQTVFPQNDVPIEGTWFESGSDGLVMGRWLAEDLGLKVGMPVMLNTRTRNGSYQVLDLTVSGIVDSPNPVINRGTIFIPLVLANEQLEMNGALTELVIGLPPGSDTAGPRQQVAATLATAGVPATVIDWRAVAGDFLSVSSAKQKSTGMMILLVLVIAAVGISNTMLMSFYERKTEIGMMRAIGMDDRALFWTFVMEAVGIGVIGSAIGLIIGAGLVAWLVNVGFDFSFILRNTDIGYRISSIFRGVWEAKSFVSALLLGLILPALTAISPTRRALKLPITESLRRDS